MNENFNDENKQRVTSYSFMTDMKLASSACKVCSSRTNRTNSCTNLAAITND